ncbi:MAG: polyphosphate polymerase domain-containing protein [Hyphomicrobiaceae bacterium]|nr:polyphosphate polymerase domain-containing protein [Hyphomicrobiaceae bacterium]
MHGSIPKNKHGWDSANARIKKSSSEPQLEEVSAHQAEQDESDIAGLFQGFEPISLEQTNAQARMLSRVDNKYVVDFGQFEAFLEAAKEHYAVLEIDGLRQFTYSSCYFDDDFACYFEHHQGRRQRFKVRTREYIDSGAQYFEIKLKGLRGKTDKHRTTCDFLVTPRVGGEYLQMLKKIYQKQYNKPMSLDLRPALMVGYRRCTLVAKAGGERVTIDYSLTFAQPGEEDNETRVGNGFIIIETKSENGYGIADTILKDHKVRKASKCSKYCIGVNLIGAVSKNNHFLPTIKRVRENLVATPDINSSCEQAGANPKSDHS